MSINVCRYRCRIPHRLQRWKSVLVFVATVVFTMPLAAQASTSEQWSLFRETIERNCMDEVSTILDNTAIWIDPFGTQSLGVAIITGFVEGSLDKQFVVCIHNKQTAEIESSSPAPLFEMLRPGVKAD